MAYYMTHVNTFMKKEFNFVPDETYKYMRANIVFYTWLALRGKGIPDGSTINKVSCDYVGMIKKHSSVFLKQDIPVLIFYSRLGLPENEELLMKENFSDIDHIMMLCLEDLRDVIPFNTYKAYYSVDLELMDHLRILVINHIKALLPYIKETALKANNHVYPEMLARNGGNAVMYCDMDLCANYIPTVYAKNGLCSWAQLRGMFTRHSHKDKASLEHAKHFKGNWQEIADYILSGNAHKAARKIYREFNINYRLSLAEGENCMVYAHYDSIEQFTQKVKPASLIIDFHTNPDLNLGNPDKMYVENHVYIYLQLLPHMSHLADGTWHTEKFVEESDDEEGVVWL